MTRVISIRFKDEDYTKLKAEAESIPTSLSEHLKFWILNRNNFLEEEYNRGIEDCKNGLVSE